jgi:hypothetical protein
MNEDSDDAWLGKINEAGQVVWKVRYGLGGNDVPVRLAATADGGYIIAGQSSSFASNARHAWLLKLDGQGRLGGLCPGGFARTVTVSNKDASGSAQRASVTMAPASFSLAPGQAVARATEYVETSQCSP